MKKNIFIITCLIFIGIFSIACSLSTDQLAGAAGVMETLIATEVSGTPLQTGNGLTPVPFDNSPEYMLTPSPEVYPELQGSVVYVAQEAGTLNTDFYLLEMPDRSLSAFDIRWPGKK